MVAGFLLRSGFPAADRARRRGNLKKEPQFALVHFLRKARSSSSLQDCAGKEAKPGANLHGASFVGFSRVVVEEGR